jgi:hypothetical protein
MGLRRTCVVVVPLVVGGLLALPAAGAESRAPSPGVAALGALPGVVAAGDSASAVDARTVQAAVTSVRKHADTSAWLHGLAAAHRAAAPDAPAPLVLAAEEPAPPAEAEPFGPLADGVPAGDLDGDGLADVLVGTFDGEAFEVRAVRGTDGSTIWSSGEDASGLLGFPLGRDATGDGRDDLLMHSVTGFGVGHDVEHPDGYDYGYTAELTHTVALVSGADGRPVWQHTRSGSEDERGSGRFGPMGATYEYSYTRRSVGADVLALLSDDLTGDGLPDVVVEAFDLDLDVSGSGADVLVAGVDESASALRAGTTVEVLEGTTGHVVGGRELHDTQDLALLLPAGQVAGTPLADLVWFSETVPDRSSACVYAVVVYGCPVGEDAYGGVGLELLEGAALAPLWSVEAAGGLPFATPLGADADTDGSPDLVLYVDAPTPRVEVRSGDDGALLWAHESGDGLQLLLGTAVDGADPVVVLGAFDRELSPLGAAAEVVVERRDAATGSLRSTRTHRSTADAADASSFGFVFVGHAAQDADGDGRPELVVGSGTAAGDDAQSVAVVEDLGTGRVVREERTDDLRLTVGYGDLDGDALLDLASIAVLLRHEDGEEGEVFFSVDADVTALRAVDDRALWRFSGDLFGVPLPAGDQDGSPGEELLASTYGEDAAVRSLRGADLGERWRLPAGR